MKHGDGDGIPIMLGPITGTTKDGETFIVCERDGCAFHAGDLDAADGLQPSCGRPKIEWDADEGCCNNFLDGETLDPMDMMMRRAHVHGVGEIGEWQYRIRGTMVTPVIFDRQAIRFPGYLETVKRCRKNRLAPGPTLSMVERAKSLRCRDMDIHNIIEASKDAGPGDCIVFDEMTGKAQATAMPRMEEPFEATVMHMMAKQVAKDWREIAVAESYCKDCAMRPTGKVREWGGQIPPNEKGPNCYGKKKWLGVNKACPYLFEMELLSDMAAELGLVEDEYRDPGRDPYEPFYEDN